MNGGGCFAMDKYSFVSRLEACLEAILGGSGDCGGGVGVGDESWR